MTILSKIFDLVSRPGIMGPHADVEADLLIAGIKPVGYLAVIEEDPPDPLFEDITEQIKRLDEEVNKGNLLSTGFTVENFTWPNGCSARVNAYFYCQPDKEAEMKIVSDNSEKYWRQGIDEDLPEDSGKYLGYTDNDIELFNNGGYDALNPIQSYIMKRTHDLRKNARIKQLLNDKPQKP
jgi:hypothetical protein